MRARTRSSGTHKNHTYTRTHTRKPLHNLRRGPLSSSFSHPIDVARDVALRVLADKAGLLLRPHARQGEGLVANRALALGAESSEGLPLSNRRQGLRRSAKPEETKDVRQQRDY